MTDYRNKIMQLMSDLQPRNKNQIAHEIPAPRPILFRDIQSLILNNHLIKHKDKLIMSYFEKITEPKDNRPYVYLAGKINGSYYSDQQTGVKQDWRWSIIGNELFDWDWNYSYFDDFIYVGPFYSPGKSHDAYQLKNCHGVGSFMEWSEFTKTKTVEYCLGAVNDADIIFAWIDSTTAHGTIVEIATACANGWGRKVTLATPVCNCIEPVDRWEEGHTCIPAEIWFLTTLVEMTGGTVVQSVEPKPAFDEALKIYNRKYCKFNSVPEKEFWTRIINDQNRGLLYNKVVPQQPVGKYRIDFAIPELKFGIEIDGLAYHNGQESFMRDRSRQREIESQGWRIVRFAAKEISLDVDKCFNEAEKIAQELRKAASDNNE